jgi:hypothetical protein
MPDRRALVRVQIDLENQALKIECTLSEFGNDRRMTEEMKTALREVRNALKRASLLFAAEVL